MIPPAVELEIRATANRLRWVASTGVFLGTQDDYFRRCKRTAADTFVIFTRDVDPDPTFRCWHLTLWSKENDAIERDVRSACLRAFFGDHLDKVWTEPPQLPLGRRYDVWHWRLFADESWSPIVPSVNVIEKLFKLGWAPYVEATN